MTSLHQHVADYLALRRALGFKLVEAQQHLASFVAYARSRSSFITVELALEWATLPRGVHPNWWAVRLAAVRHLATYLAGIDPRTEVPGRDLLPRRASRATPYCYQDGDIAKLTRAALRLPQPLRGRTYATLIALLAVTGVRVGEAIRLDRDDVDWDHAILTIRRTKFGKSRQIPVHRSTIAALRDYARVRDRSGVRSGSPSFFMSLRGTRLIYKNVQRVFHQFVLDAGIAPGGRARIHDLRHTFAVRTLLGWYRRRVDVAARMPQLSTYLGHGDPAATYWYLTAAPELLALAGRRLELAARRHP